MEPHALLEDKNLIMPPLVPVITGAVDHVEAETDKRDHAIYMLWKMQLLPVSYWRGSEPQRDSEG